MGDWEILLTSFGFNNVVSLHIRHYFEIILFFLCDFGEWLWHNQFFSMILVFAVDLECLLFSLVN